MGQYVGIDLHRRSTTIVRMAEDGEVLGTQRFVSQPFELAQAMAAAGPKPEVVLESTYGWYWAADVLQELGAHVHLAHALGNNWGNRRVKNDVRDTKDLAAMLALGRLAEGNRTAGGPRTPRARALNADALFLEERHQRHQRLRHNLTVLDGFGGGL